ncbi:hypothetical protein [Actinacidiphila guanduensis]|uniref:Uncharacterized protein n=1 Tax=Actinacidiphila guanduensis TaxID=310781 RepID=A0A1H0B2C1_9ACTN|nr:hypothetical protein [Actinacidiphila guanduensis]SDN39790.1 hypothetical protein SAMN05216259_10421 [Actinacidiphila guanduensis]
MTGRRIGGLPAAVGRGARASLQVLVLAAALGAAGACSPAASRPTGSTAGSRSSPTTASAATTPPAALTLDEHAPRTGVHVRSGTVVVVRLHSTYWSTPTSSDPAVLVPGGGGSSPAGSCPPGGGCGVASARFTAAHPGTAHVTAHRSSCGEAMRCPPGQDSYEVTVTVSREP